MALLQWILQFGSYGYLDNRVGIYMRQGQQIALFVLLGVVVGMVILLVRLSRATSYLSDDPAACINCHVMDSAYASWLRGSHGTVAVCNDCHLPHHNPVAKLMAKARDGMRHSFIFTIRREPQVMKLAWYAEPAMQQNCMRCHDSQMLHVRVAGVEERRCWDCHHNIHGKVISLSATPHARRPELPRAGVGFGSNNEEKR